MPNMELSRDEAITVLTRRATRAWLKKHKKLAWFGFYWLVVTGAATLFLTSHFETTLEALTIWGKLLLYVPVMAVWFWPFVTFVLIDSRHAAQAKREVP